MLFSFMANVCDPACKGEREEKQTDGKNDPGGYQAPEDERDGEGQSRRPESRRGQMLERQGSPAARVCGVGGFFGGRHVR